MDTVAVWSNRDRADLFNEVGAVRNLATAIVEKDFWVCWTLKRLFGDGISPGLVFKGGTSLSKGYGLIERFSEDIDLSFDRSVLGHGDDKDPEKAESAKQADRLIKALVADVQAHIAGSFLPSLSRAIEARLGASGPVWDVTIDAQDPQTINFRYPSSLAEGDYANVAYVNPLVRLELGARGDPWPAVSRTITPYAAEEHPELFQAPSCEVNTLAIERTFWEKATILHAEYHRPLGKGTAERVSRHYYDLAMICRSEFADAALSTIDLLEVVANHKALYFRSGWAGYDTAEPGTLRLTPPDSRLADLKSDYAKMAQMFFGEPLPFDELMVMLAELERRINQTSGS